MRKIIIDIDGVLASFNEPARQLLLTQGANMRPFENDSDPLIWNWFQSYGATAQQQRAMWAHIHSHPEWWGQLPIHRDFRQACREVLWDVCDTHEVTFVTSRPNGRDITASWLNFYLPGYRAHVVLTPHRKVMALAAMEPDAVIEDKLSTLQEYRGVVAAMNLPKCQLFLVDRPYNRDGDRMGLTVVASTQEALEAV